ncbi:MAG TPA: ATP-binding cassette domain-containing protein [Gemmatimonadaceae bacterium]|nr:ATP-binding cassette domain-containing protein [Gemmatimonadaceae bacterium]
MSAEIDVQELSKSFHTREPRGPGARARLADTFAPRSRAVLAVDRITFRIEAGERVAFIGPNGAGKSTTLKILAGILSPTSGRATVAGLVPWRDRHALGFAIGTVFGQRSQLWYQLAPRDTIELLARVYELPRAVWRSRLDALSHAFELAPLLDRPVRQLSLGERMRCEVAASLLHAPHVLFLDEPTIGLDVTAKATIRELLHKRSTEDGTTLLLTSHDTGDIEQVCDRVVIIHRGRILLDAAVGELKRRYLRSRRVTLITASEHVELPAAAGARLVSTAPHRTTVEIDAGDSAVGALVDAVLRQTTLRDLVIDDPPMDEIIRSIYQNADDDEGEAA